MRKLLSKVDWVIVGLMSAILSTIALAGWSYNYNAKAYDTQCIKAGGTPVFNGEFRECLGVKSIH